MKTIIEICRVTSNHEQESDVSLKWRVKYDVNKELNKFLFINNISSTYIRWYPSVADWTKQTE